MAVTVLATYDVRHDARRAQLARTLQAYGDRVQKSVFLLLLTHPDELQQLHAAAKKRIDPDTDSLWLVTVCTGCRQQILTSGQIRSTDKNPCWIVV